MTYEDISEKDREEIERLVRLFQRDSIQIVTDNARHAFISLRGYSRSLAGHDADADDLSELDAAIDEVTRVLLKIRKDNQ